MNVHELFDRWKPQSTPHPSHTHRSSNPELSPSPHREPRPSTTAPPSPTYALSLSLSLSLCTVDDIFPFGVCSVSPMEACEILGGEACNARMFPEAKLAAAVASEEIDREYLEYNDPKTLPCKAT
ncbi:hypothetical protein BHM03_00040152 [Ensete ventricosum]|nr:hypothetical protein BHM03_00040152 [Ensete ventricosum]